MENYVVMIVAGITFFVLSFLSGCWYTRWKSGIKKERDYDAMVRQFRRFERDDEYRQIRQRLTEEISNYNQNEQRPIAARKLYAMRVESKKENKTILFIMSLFLYLMILCMLLFFVLCTPEDVSGIIIGETAIFLALVLYGVIGVKRYLRCLKTMYIMEDIIKDLGSGIPSGKKEALNLNEMNELVNALKPAKKEHSISTLI